MLCIYVTYMLCTYILYMYIYIYYIHVYYICIGDTGRQLRAGGGDWQDPCIRLAPVHTLPRVHGPGHIPKP